MAELKVLETRRQRDNAEIVEMLKDYLARAEAGDFTEVAIVCVSREGGASYGWLSWNAHELAGAIDLMQHKFLADIIAGRTAHVEE